MSDRDRDQFFLQLYVALATIGSICILIATFIIDKLEIKFIEEIVAGFLLTGFLMILSSSAIAIHENFGKESRAWGWIFIKIPAYISFLTFFLSSLVLLISYVASLIN